LPKLRSASGLGGLGTLFSVGVIGGLSDRQLLERFVSRRGEAGELAFAALVERHGPMVLRVCRRLLHDSNDVEDAFQGTFLVLARKSGGSLWVRDSIGPWLHNVACRIAARVRSDSARRRRHERQAAALATTTVHERGWDDLGCLLHQEVERLPERFRSPIVLCYLEGLTHEEAAQQLGWPVGTVRSRLSRGRDKLRDRLERRGAVPSAGLLAARLTHDNLTVPRALVGATLQGVSTGTTPAVAALAATVLRAALFKRLIQISAVVLAIGVGGIGMGGLADSGSGKKRVANSTRRAFGHQELPPRVDLAEKPAAERTAERVLTTGSELFDAKAAKALAATFTVDGEIHLFDMKTKREGDIPIRGRADIEGFYVNMFEDASTIHSQNTVEFARFVAPDVLIIHGRFRPNVGEQELPFIQLRVKQRDEWLLSKLWLFLSPKEKR
jgi:RNA polymerase sigma factor (sigma-70 family)